MKKIFLLSTILAGSFLVANVANAQFQLSVNLSTQPAWGPAGYDYAENYYLPDVEAYYCVPRRQFVYFDRGNWVYASSLPARCGNYDLYSGYKVVINERNPWAQFNNHRSQYAPYRYRHDQVVIRDSRGGNYGRPDDDGRNRSRDYGYNNRDDRNNNYDRRQDRGRDNDRNRNHDKEHDNRGGRGWGRW